MNHNYLPFNFAIRYEVRIDGKTIHKTRNLDVAKRVQYKIPNSAIMAICNTLDLRFYITTQETRYQIITKFLEMEYGKVCSIAREFHYEEIKNNEIIFVATSNFYYICVQIANDFIIKKRYAHKKAKKRKSRPKGNGTMRGVADSDSIGEVSLGNSIDIQQITARHKEFCGLSPVRKPSNPIRGFSQGNGDSRFIADRGANNDRLPYGRNNGKPKGGGPITILSEYFCEYGSNINGLAEQKNAMLTNGPWCGRVRTPIVTATGKIIPKGELVICILPNSYKDKSKYSQRLQHRGPYSNSYTYIPVKPNKNAEFYVNGIYNAFRPQNQIVAWESMDILPILVGDRFCSDDNDFIITNISVYGIATLKCKQVSNGEYQIPLFLLFSKLYFGLKCWYYPNPKPLQALLLMDFSFNEEYDTNIFEKSLETPTNVVTLQGKPTDDTPPLSNPFQKGDILLSSYYWDGTLFKVTSASNSNVVVKVINGNCHTTELIHREMFPSFSKATLQQLAITLEV